MSLPEPLVPQEVDLRGLTFMPLTLPGCAIAT